MNQKHLTLWNYVADANIFKVHKPVWDSFSAADKDIVRASAEQAAKEHTRSTPQGLGAGGDRSSLDELAKRNVKVDELTEQEKAAFGRATKAGLREMGCHHAAPTW